MLALCWPVLYFKHETMSPSITWHAPNSARWNVEIMQTQQSVSYCTHSPIIRETLHFPQFSALGSHSWEKQRLFRAPNTTICKYHDDSLIPVMALLLVSKLEIIDSRGRPKICRQPQEIAEHTSSCDFSASTGTPANHPTCQYFHHFQCVSEHCIATAQFRPGGRYKILHLHGGAATKPGNPKSRTPHLIFVLSSSKILQGSGSPFQAPLQLIPRQSLKL